LVRASELVWALEMARDSGPEPEAELAEAFTALAVRYPRRA
jgi:hypothetical protein